MALNLISPPEHEPVSLDEAKLHLRIDHDDEDALILSYIAAARSWAEGQTRRAFVPQVWEYTFDAFPRGGVILPRDPVLSVDSVKYVNPDGDFVEFAEGSPLVPLYEVTRYFERTAVIPKDAWPATRRGGIAGAIQFTAGYENVPADIKHAILLMVAHFYEIRQPAIVGTSVGRVPMSVDALLSPYSVVGF